MTNFEKLAAQFDSIGEILSISEIEQGMREMPENDENDVASTARTFRLLGIAMQKKPEAMRQLVAIEKDIPREDVDALPDSALVSALVQTFMGAVVPFFAPKRQPEKKH